MAKSKYADQFAQGKSLLDEIYDEQVGRLDRAEPKDRKSTLIDWADLAGAETAVKERYLGRYLFELIQNAHDAIAEAQMDSTTPLDLLAMPHCVRFELSNHSLLVANYGKPFAADNVRSLCRLHTSTKNASKQIGHKGIGFKSVLEITDSPEVYSDIYAFGYSRDDFHRDVARVMKSDWNPSIPLPILRVPYMRYINQLPGEERDCIESLLDDGYVTVIRLPLGYQQTRVDQVADDLKKSIQPTLLLFMPALWKIEIRYPDNKEIWFYREDKPTPYPGMKEVLVYISDQTSVRTDSRWLVLGPIKRDLPDRTLVAELDKAWQEVTALQFTFAFPLDIDTGELTLSGKSQPFYVYFPTQEFSGLRFAVQADFYVGDDRKTLSPNALNRWLTEEMCSYLAGNGVELLKKYWPNSAELVELLAPVSRQEREFPRTFMEQYLQYLGISPFVPVQGGQYRPPSDTRLPPIEVDRDNFCSLFPPSKLRGDAKWVYPIREVVEAELKRRSPFLRHLGSQVITPEMVIDALSRDGLPPVSDCRDLIAFLADWWNTLPTYPDNKREAFEKLLSDLPILPTGNGWQTPKHTLVFQANLRPNIRDVSAPAGFEFSVILRSTYPDSGTYSNPYKFFRALKAREYSARDIIRDAILPILTDAEKFNQLLVEHPNSVFEAYELLKEYFQDDGTTRGFENRLSQVPVPAVGRGFNGWKPAGECYFGSAWPGGEQLEALFYGFEDCYFLADTSALAPSSESLGEGWTRFFQWLGVRNQPILLSADRTLSWMAPDPFNNPRPWSEYMNAYTDRFECQNQSKSHGYSRLLNNAHTLHHFSDLVQENNAQKLVTLYSILAQFWAKDYRPFARATLACEYTSTGCPSERIEDYLLYQLRYTPWLPVQIDSEWTAPLPPNQIWVLGETDPVDVRRLVPTFPLELRAGAYQDFVADLGFISSSTAQVEDYIQLLSLLPERYPLNVADSASERLGGWQRSVRAIFNWICERIQVGLVNRGDTAPARPANLKVLAYREEQLCYVDIESPDLVYPDNNFLAERWKSHCALLRINDDWRRLQNWLEVPNLSEVIESQWYHEGDLEIETQQLQELFRRTIPYYLALIKQAQPANYDSILSRLERLYIQVVEQLTVEERIPRLSEPKTITSRIQVHLERVDEPNPRGGPQVRGGRLYVTKEILDNLDLLGDYLADYIGIARLGDAFVLLINRPADADKQRFIKSKSVGDATLIQVFNDWNETYKLGEDTSRREMSVSTGFLNKISLVTNPDIAPTPIISELESEQALEIDISQGEEYEDSDTQEMPKPSYPPLSPETEGEIIFAPNNLVATGDATGGKGGHGGGSGTGHMPSPGDTEEVGRRGEEWVYWKEKERLKKEYGFDPAELEEMEELVWVSRKQPMANYDIRSIYVTESGEQRTVYIEVKASVGNNRNIRMSQAEFQLALKLQEDYWLCYVANAGDARPNLPVCYRNLARYITEERVDLHVETISMTLPKLSQNDLS